MPGRPSSLFLKCWIIAVTLAACNNGAEKPYSNCITTKDSLIPLTIVQGKALNLYLDSLMVLGISTPIDYHAKEQILYAFDSYGKRLLEYPLRFTADTIRPRHIQAVHVKHKISYIKYISPDSLILYAYGGARLFYYSMRRGAIDKEYSFLKNKVAGRNAAPPYANAAAPFLFIGQTITGFGFLLGEKEGENPVYRTICATIQLPSGNTSYRLPYSGVYRQHNWGGSHLRTPYATYNEQKQQLLLSLPADHNIQVVNRDWEVKDVYAGTRRNICISSMGLSKDNEKLLDVEYALQYYTNTPSYRNIIYDPYQDRYYRILELPPAKEELPGGKPAGKAASLIAFDRDFRYLGEAALPDGLALDNFFITAEGLYFLNVRNKDQNIAQYALCKIIVPAQSK